VFGHILLSSIRAFDGGVATQVLAKGRRFLRFRGAVIISAGFKECGPAGAELEKQVVQRRGQRRIIGPNCVGLMLPHIGLNATFARPLAVPGNIAARPNR
jgi:hypothetical protein